MQLQSSQLLQPITTCSHRSEWGLMSPQHPPTQKRCHNVLTNIFFIRQQSPRTSTPQRATQPGFLAHPQPQCFIGSHRTAYNDLQGGFPVGSPTTPPSTSHCTLLFSTVITTIQWAAGLPITRPLWEAFSIHRGFPCPWKPPISQRMPAKRPRSGYSCTS